MVRTGVGSDGHPLEEGSNSTPSPHSAEPTDTLNQELPISEQMRRAAEDHRAALTNRQGATYTQDASSTSREQAYAGANGQVDQTGLVLGVPDQQTGMLANQPSVMPAKQVYGLLDIYPPAPEPWELVQDFVDSFNATQDLTNEVLTDTKRQMKADTAFRDALNLQLKEDYATQPFGAVQEIWHRLVNFRDANHSRSQLVRQTRATILGVADIQAVFAARFGQLVADQMLAMVASLPETARKLEETKVDFAYRMLERDESRFAAELQRQTYEHELRTAYQFGRDRVLGENDLNYVNAVNAGREIEMIGATLNEFPVIMQMLREDGSNQAQQILARLDSYLSFMADLSSNPDITGSLAKKIFMNDGGRLLQELTGLSVGHLRMKSIVPPPIKPRARRSASSDSSTSDDDVATAAE